MTAWERKQPPLNVYDYNTILELKLRLGPASANMAEAWPSEAQVLKLYYT